jgi:hypothetical protein
MNFRFPVQDVMGPIFDLTPKDSLKGFYIILCNPDFVKHMNKEELKNSALKLFCTYYPNEENNIHDLFEDIIVLNWMDNQPWIPAVSYYYPPGVLSKYGSQIRQPFGNIYWGGSERSIKGLHWIEGALNRGNDVAGQILLKTGHISTMEQYNDIFYKWKKNGVSKIIHSDNLTNYQNFFTSIRSTLDTIFFHHEYPNEGYRTINLTRKEQKIFDQKLALK